jgi:SAM-dependent methyltransferase
MDWATSMGEKWLAYIDRLEGMTAPFGAALLEHAALQPGERAVDIGCGGGDTSLAAAAAVGPGGSVLGLDISSALTAAAERRAEVNGLKNLAFLTADAATAMPLGAPFDRMLSLFGIMFFDQPKAAFANLRRMIKKGGRADFAVWAPVRDNPWRAEVVAVLGRHIELPVPQPGTPGPFALSDPDYINKLLDGAGFKAIDIQALTRNLPFSGPGSTPDLSVNFAMEFYFSQILANQPQDIRDNIAAELHDLFSRYHEEEGVIMAAKIWLVTARA